MNNKNFENSFFLSKNRYNDKPIYLKKFEGKSN